MWRYTYTRSVVGVGEPCQSFGSVKGFVCVFVSWTHINALSGLPKLYKERNVDIQLKGSPIGFSTSSVFWGFLTGPIVQVTKGEL